MSIKKLVSTVVFLGLMSTHLLAQEVGDSNSASGSDTVIGVMDFLERQTTGNDLTCQYIKGNTMDSHEGSVMLECMPHDSAGQVSQNNKVCMIEKMQCFSLATGHFEVENLKFYVNQRESCRNINPTEAFSNYIDPMLRVNFVGDH
jgi:hypothetical protein